MSFQEPGSDISRLNREAYVRPVRVDARTYAVLRQAADVSKRSGGTFDVTVAPCLVNAGLTQPPCCDASPDPRAQWSDVHLLSDQHVRFDRPLWIDVSGIAKGYAVDCAMSLLARAQPAQACVNAGGDLSVRGARAEQVRLDVEPGCGYLVPVVELRDGSMASSGSRPGSGMPGGLHVDGSTQRPAPQQFVSVLAPSCVVADALTKVVMARGEQARPVLRAFAARAIISEGHGWREIA